MKIRTKLLLVLASVLLLVVALGLMDMRYAAETRTDVGRLEKAVVSASSAALGMLDALSKLETDLAAANNGETGPANALQIRNQGERSFQEFHRHLHEAAVAAGQEMEISLSDRTAPRNDPNRHDSPP